MILISNTKLLQTIPYLSTVNSLISGHHRCKKNCPLIGGVRLLESLFFLVSNGFLVSFSYLEGFYGSKQGFVDIGS